jgi:tripartite-type tricarboxylate transporter receptor subunit TctC
VGVLCTVGVQEQEAIRMKKAGIVIGFALAAQAGLAAAQGWPTKPIRLIIGFPPGGGADAVARPIADALSAELGQPVIVDNRPGAGTTIAAAAAASAAPDGYTLFMHNNSAYGNLQVIYKDFKYSGKDYTAITRWTTAPLLLAVSNELGVDTVGELVERAKAEPGKLNYASSGVGGGTHLPGLMFTRSAGVDIVHVPYKGGAPALQGVVAGETQMSFATPPSVLPLARAGRLKVIAVTSARRSPLFPELPTIAEGGIEDYEYSFSFGLFGPAGLPAQIVERLFEASRKVLADPELRAKLEASGNEAAPSESPAAFKRAMEEEGARERELSIAAGAGT